MFFKQAAMAIVAAMAGVVVVFLIAQAISPDLRVDSWQEDNQKLTIPNVTFTVLFQGVVGAIVGWILFHFRKPRLWWYVIVAIVLILGVFNAFNAADTNETAIWLNVMHLVAAGAIVPTIARMLPDRQGPAS
jgi:cell division protein FtsW (lipid II flippase)